MNDKCTYKLIRKALKKLGIAKAIVSNSTYDNTPCVLLRWNGQEEYVSGTHLALGPEDIMGVRDDEYTEWLTSIYADANLK
jgi:hypothetical protein